MNVMINGFIESRGIKIHYIANEAEGKRLSLLFVPGIMMPAWIFDKQLDYFSKDYHVVAMEPRSHGDSDLSSEGHYALSLAEDIKAVVDQLNLQPFILIGWSIAVSQVVNYAAHFASKQLIGLVLIDGLLGIDSTLPFYQKTVDYWSSLQTDRIPKTKEFVQEIFKLPHTQDFYERLTDVALRMPTNTVMTLIYNYILQDFHPLLPQINIPTLITTVNGPRLDYMQQMKSLLPQGHLEVIESAGHALFVDQPEAFNGLLEKFIKGCAK